MISRSRCHSAKSLGICTRLALTFAFSFAKPVHPFSSQFPPSTNIAREITSTDVKISPTGHPSIHYTSLEVSLPCATPSGDPPNTYAWANGVPIILVLEGNAAPAFGLATRNSLGPIHVAAGYTAALGLRDSLAGTSWSLEVSLHVVWCGQGVDDCR